MRIELRKSCVEEVVNAGAVFGGDGKDGSAEAVEDGGVVDLRRGVDLVYGDDERFAGGAEEAGEFFVEGGETGLAVDDENEQGSFLDGDVCLSKDLLRDEGFVVGDDAAGVDDFDLMAAPFGFAVDAVARDAGFVGDDGAARSGQAIEERGLADVGAADDHERWKFFL